MFIGGWHLLSGPKHPVTRLHAEVHAKGAPPLTVDSKCASEGAASRESPHSDGVSRKVEADGYRRSLLPPSTLQVQMQGLKEGEEVRCVQT